MKLGTFLTAVAVSLTLCAAEPAPATSGRSAWIVFSASPEHGTLPTQLFRISLSGSGLRQITSGVRAASEPAFSPDGQKIAFARVSAGIFVVRVDGSGLDRLTRGANDRFPVWSPNGHEVAFLRAVKHHLRLAVIDSAGRRQRTLRVSPEPAGRPAWAANGRSIVIATLKGSFVQVDAQTGKVQRLLGVKFELADGTPSWSLSPDGRKIALLARRPASAGCSAGGCDVFAIYVGAVSSSRLRPVVKGGGFPGWTPDSRRLVYTTRGGFAVKAPNGGAPRLIAVDDAVVPAGDAPPAWQP
jgi:Tol biopolymer transport system component